MRPLRALGLGLLGLWRQAHHVWCCMVHASGLAKYDLVLDGQVRFAGLRCRHCGTVFR